MSRGRVRPQKQRTDDPTRLRTVDQPPATVGSTPREGGTSTRQEYSQEFFSGPIPPPSILADYDDIIPGGAERILAMAERQSAHRQKIEADVVRTNCKSQTRGQVFAFIGFIVVIGAGTYLLLDNRPIEGLVALATGVGSSLWVFREGRRRQEQERSRATSTAR